MASAEHGPWRTFGRTCLTRTAVLERMSGPLCETALGLHGAGTTLTGLARSNLLLVPLDRLGLWYPYHHLYRNMSNGSSHTVRTEVKRSTANWASRPATTRYKRRQRSACLAASRSA